MIDQGNTIPFIARYRKEATGSMDDQVLRDLGDRLEYLRGLDKRKEEVTSSITEQGAMTPELTAALTKAKTLAEVEDLSERLESRKAVDHAKGLLMEGLGLSEPEAFRWIQKTAMDLRKSMREVAEGVIDHSKAGKKPKR